MSDHRKRVATAAPPPLFKQKSWSPDTFRDEAWLRRQDIHRNGRRSRSVTEEDLDELKGCIELGFGFDSPELDRKLSDTLPALGLFYAVNKSYSDSLTKSPPPTLFSSFFFVVLLLLSVLRWVFFVPDWEPSSDSQSRRRSSSGEGKVETVGASGGMFGEAID
ncbi:hypothetical protein Scep_020297 [Stephania cephalantha]|uniref:Uncharacterized protein n=1 Tax=Stephania cephalantha TaxID=152367 RepID=A0AAP0NN21_9MAGN